MVGDLKTKPDNPTDLKLDSDTGGGNSTMMMVRQQFIWDMSSMTSNDSTLMLVGQRDYQRQKNYDFKPCLEKQKLLIYSQSLENSDDSRRIKPNSRYHIELELNLTHPYKVSL